MDLWLVDNMRVGALYRLNNKYVDAACHYICSPTGLFTNPFTSPELAHLEYPIFKTIGDTWVDLEDQERRSPTMGDVVMLASIGLLRTYHNGQQCDQGPYGFFLWQEHLVLLDSKTMDDV